MNKRKHFDPFGDPREARVRAIEERVARLEAGGAALIARADEVRDIAVTDFDIHGPQPKGDK